jgi:hypothetical protein
MNNRLCVSLTIFSEIKYNEPRAIAEFKAYIHLEAFFPRRTTK